MSSDDASMLITVTIPVHRETALRSVLIDAQGHGCVFSFSRRRHGATVEYAFCPHVERAVLADLLDQFTHPLMLSKEATA